MKEKEEKGKLPPLVAPREVDFIARAIETREKVPDTGRCRSTSYRTVEQRCSTHASAHKILHWVFMGPLTSCFGVYLKRGGSLSFENIPVTSSSLETHPEPSLGAVSVGQVTARLVWARQLPAGL